MKIIPVILLMPYMAASQTLAVNKYFTNPDYSLITYVHWRQIPKSGNLTTNIVSPDSLRTRVLNLSKAGVYQFELTVMFLKSGVTTTAKDTVNVNVAPPIKDSVFIVQAFPTSKAIELISKVQSTAKIAVINKVVKQSYNYTAYSGLRVVYVTGLSPGDTVRVILNGKTYYR